MPAPPSMFDTPHSADHLPADNYIQPNLGHGLRIWWAFFWPTSFAAAVISLAVNIFVRSLYQDLKLSAAVASPFLKYDAYFFTYLVALFVTAYILRKNFRAFRIGLLSNHGGQGAVALPPTLRRTLRVWWTYSWRSFIYRLIATFVVSFPLGWIVAFLMALLKPGPAFAVVLNIIVATAIDGAVGLFVIYSSILDEDISDFRVALLPPDRSASAIPVQLPARPPLAPQKLPGEQ